MPEGNGQSGCPGPVDVRDNFLFAGAQRSAYNDDTRSYSGTGTENGQKQHMQNEVVSLNRLPYHRA